MYGLPEGIDLGFLQNRQLLQVCIGLNEAILNFDDELSITIMTDIYHEATDGKVAVYEQCPFSASMLSQFLGCSIVEATWNTEGALRMRFSNGDSLEIRDDSKVYECYQIRHHDGLIVV